MSVRPFSSVGACSNRFFGPILGYGESPCFSRGRVSWVVDVGYQGLALVCSNITFIVDGVV